MERRAILKGLAVGLPVAAAGAAATSARFIKDKGDQGFATLEKTVASMQEQLDQLKSRYRESDERNRKLVRVAVGAAALSLGVDLGALL